MVIFTITIRVLLCSRLHCFLTYISWQTISRSVQNLWRNQELAQPPLIPRKPLILGRIPYEFCDQRHSHWLIFGSAFHQRGQFWLPIHLILGLIWPIKVWGACNGRTTQQQTELASRLRHSELNFWNWNRLVQWLPKVKQLELWGVSIRVIFWTLKSPRYKSLNWISELDII